MTTPATPAEAEELAKTAVTKYLNSCQIADKIQISNYLMKLCSVAGVIMAQSDGSKDASERLHATAFFIEKNAPKTPFKLIPIH